jgi:hypothetical protein
VLIALGYPTEKEAINMAIRDGNLLLNIPYSADDIYRFYDIFMECKWRCCMEEP